MYLTKHFNSEEFDCQCGCGTGNIMQNLVLKLEEVRVAINRPMKINSGIRCFIIAILHPSSPKCLETKLHGIYIPPMLI